MTAAPAASHSLAVTTSSFSVTGRAGTADLSASAPVGATVISVVVLPAMTGTLPSRGLACRQGQVLAGEGQRLGQVRLPVLPRRCPVGLHLDHYHALVPGPGELPEEACAGLAPAAGHQVLVRHGPDGVSRAVGQVHVGEPVAQLAAMTRA